MSEEEVIAALDESLVSARQELNRIKAELKICQGELDWARQKLKEAEERNRKLDWVLTRTIEAL